MSHFDARVNHLREELVSRMVKDRAAFLRELEDAAGAHDGTGPTSTSAHWWNHLTLESKAHRSIFSPLLYLLQLGYQGQQAFRRAISRGKGST
jgi:hypothetical protein